MVVLLRLNRALIKDDGIEMHTATKQAFKIMFRWYFSTKVEYLLLSGRLFVNNISFWTAKTSFQSASADSW